MRPSVLTFFRRSDFAAVLAHRSFRYLLAAYIVSSVGNGVFFYEIIFHLFWLQDTLVSTSLLVSASTLPILAVRPLAGLVADRMDRKSLMLFAHVALVAVVTALILVGQIGELNGYFLAVGAFLLMAAGQLFYAAREAVLPGILARKELVAGNAALAVVYQPITLAGSAVAGFLIAAVGELNALGFVLFMYALAAFLISGIEVPEQAGTRRTVVAAVPLHKRLVAVVTDAMRDLALAVYFIFEKPLVRSVAFTWVILGVLQRSVLLIAVARFIDDSLLDSSMSITMSNSIRAVGVIVVLLAIPWAARQLGDGRVGLVALSALGVLFTAMSVLGELWQGLPIIVAISMVTAAKLPLWSILQVETPDQMRGRVLANLGTISLILVVLAGHSISLLIELTGPRPVYLATGVVALILGLALLRVKEVRRARLAAD